MSDPLFSDILALVDMDTSDFTDRGPLFSPWTALGGAVSSPDNPKFGNNGLFDGSSCISTPHNAAFNIGSQDFTLEMWVYLPTGGANSGILFEKGAQTISIFYGASNELAFYASSTGSSWNLAADRRFATNPAKDTWHHLAVTRSGSDWRLFFNGVLATTYSVTGSIATNTDPLTIGGKASLVSSFDGRIDDLMWSVGARYTANFTPPASPFDPGPAVYQLTGTGVWAAPADGTIEGILVGGGGSGAANQGGGGGAGEIQEFGPIPVTVGQQFAYSVGNGGASSGGGTRGNGGSGNPTSFAGVPNAIGGGGGSGNFGVPGLNGGSGGGGDGPGATAGGQAIGTGFGNDGGPSGGSGGGAGGPGNNTDRVGGIGRDYSALFGTNVGDDGWFGGGGAGGVTGAPGGKGGGGIGSSEGNFPAGAGMPATGGGGGGATNSHRTGGLGATGTIIFVLSQGPTVVTSPLDTTVEAGSPVTLTVSANGEGAVSYQWFRDAVAIPGETGTSYAFTAGPADDGAQFYVVITDDNGTAQTATATITVTIPALSFIDDLDAETGVLIGTQVTLSVATNLPCSFVWTEVGVGVIPGETGPSLTLQSSVSGRQFFVTATDEFNQSLQSTTATVTINRVVLDDQTQQGTPDTSFPDQTIRASSTDWAGMVAAAEGKTKKVPDYIFSNRTFYRIDKLLNPKDD